MRTVVVGAGTVGRQHLAALESMPECVLLGVVEPAACAASALPAHVRVWPGLEQALADLAGQGPECVVITAPPPASLGLARRAAEAGARVLVEKPVVIDPDELSITAGDEQIFVGFQPHVAPGVAALLQHPPDVAQAQVELVCRRDAEYFRGWRGHWAQAGGILHQQAIHGLALALRLMPEAPVLECTARVWHERRYSPAEDAVEAELVFEDGRRLLLHGCTDAAMDRQRRHELRLSTANGSQLHLTGRNLEAGLGPAHAAPDAAELRRSLYRALASRAGHPCLFPLAGMPRVLEVITYVYRTAEQCTGRRGSYRSGDRRT